VRISQAFFDLNGTLFDPAAMGTPLEGEGRDLLVDEMLDGAVRLAMVETLTGSYRDFADLLRASASRTLALAGQADRLDEVASAVLEMRPYADGIAAVETLRAAGIAVGILTNSSTEAARSLIAKAELPDLDPIVGTDQVRAFKLDRRVYERGVEAAGRPAGEVVLITAHSWDALGANRAGLLAAWIAARERARPPIEPAPDFEAADLLGAAEQIAGERTA